MQDLDPLSKIAILQSTSSTSEEKALAKTMKEFLDHVVKEQHYPVWSIHAASSNLRHEIEALCRNKASSWRMQHIDRLLEQGAIVLPPRDLNYPGGFAQNQQKIAQDWVTACGLDPAIMDAIANRAEQNLKQLKTLEDQDASLVNTTGASKPTVPR